MTRRAVVQWSPVTAITEAKVYAMVIGRTLAELREQHDLSQAEMAKRVGLTQPTLSRIERGETQPDPFTLHKIAAQFGMSLSSLIEQVEHAYLQAQTQARANAHHAAGTANTDDGWIPAVAALGVLGLASIVGLAVAATLAESSSRRSAQPTAERIPRQARKTP